MQKTAMLGAAAVLLVATPATAQSGYVDLAYANIDLESGGFEQSSDGFRFGGAAAFDAGGLGAQLNGGVANLDDGGTDVTIWGVDGHLYQRNGQWLFGGTLGFRTADNGSGDDTSTWLAALQTHYEMERTTLVGAVSYSDLDSGTDQAQLWGADGELRFFATDNFRIDGALGWRQIEFDGPGDSSDWHGGIGAELQFDAWPVSIFGGYAHTRNDDADFSFDAVSLGLRFNWGGTLKDRDRSGATMMRPGDGLSANGLP